MAAAQKGNTVKVHYTGKLDDGTVFDSSLERDPLEFTLGQGQVIPGFEQAVLGLEPDQSKTFTIPCAEAYGPYRQEMVMDVDRSQFPDEVEPKVGQQFDVKRGEEGKVARVRIIDIAGDKITLDANHPLAGKDLTFEVRLVEVA
jgi:peptidylprolyl isomerase